VSAQLQEIDRLREQPLLGTPVQSFEMAARQGLNAAA